MPSFKTFIVNDPDRVRASVFAGRIIKSRQTDADAFKIERDASITLLANARLLTVDYKNIENSNFELPFKINDTDMKISFDFDSSVLKSFKNFPRKIPNVYLRLIDCGITSIENIPEEMDRLLMAGNDRLESYAGIGSKIKKCDEMIMPTVSIKSSILGFLLIDRLESLMFDMFSPTPHFTAVAFQILHKHFKGEKDVLDCKAELIENKLSEFAKL
jgi:hypothetical protein